jgi:hypothetical protein
MVSLSPPVLQQALIDCCTTFPYVTTQHPLQGPPQRTDKSPLISNIDYLDKRIQDMQINTTILYDQLICIAA